ncbi:MAG TPA: hypothetical protein VIR76_10990, partial [Pusillimonas sp.]
CSFIQQCFGQRAGALLASACSLPTVGATALAVRQPLLFLIFLKTKLKFSCHKTDKWATLFNVLT